MLFDNDNSKTVEIQEMTWPELKAALAAGKTTALFYTGGTEQRGPQNIIAGHNYLGREMVKHIAEKLGNAIAMPVMPFSPTRADPENPGNIGLSEGALGAVMEEVSEQAIANGFKNVVLMGDSGGGQGPDGMYDKLAKKHFDAERFEEFCGTHLKHLDEVALEFFGTDAAKEIFRQKVGALFPKHEVNVFTEHFYAQVQEWRTDYAAEKKL